MPVDAYSLAVSCGGRGVSCDIWPASLVRHAPRRALPFSGTTGLPRPARCVAPRPVFAATPVSRHCAFPRQCGFPGRRWCRPHPRATADMADRALRCVDRLRRCVAAWHWVVTLLRVTPSRRALPFPATSLCGDQVMRGTLAPCHHAGTNFLLTETLAATGLEADFAPRHYRIPPTPDNDPFRQRHVLRQLRSDGAQAREPVLRVCCRPLGGVPRYPDTGSAPRSLAHGGRRHLPPSALAQRQPGSLPRRAVVSQIDRLKTRFFPGLIHHRTDCRGGIKREIPQYPGLFHHTRDADPARRITSAFCDSAGLPVAESWLSAMANRYVADRLGVTRRAVAPHPRSGLTG